jgi:hypothetical protein
MASRKTALITDYRVRRLGLDGVLDHVFCPQDHLLPEGLSADDLRKYPSEHYRLNYAAQDYTPKGSKKPDVEVLDSIVTRVGLKKEECVYIGDSLMKDVAMAIDCGIDDVWAKYGQAHKRPEYKLLQEVTHWTPEEVAREQKIKERVDVHPTRTLEKSLSEILKLHSDGKIEFFYKSVMFALLLTTVLLASTGGLVVAREDNATAGASSQIRTLSCKVLNEANADPLLLECKHVK